MKSLENYLQFKEIYRKSTFKHFVKVSQKFGQILVCVRDKLKSVLDLMDEHREISSKDLFLGVL